MTTKIVPVILAGGQGTRLWPLSRTTRPKQFIELMGEHSLFQQTLARLSGSDRYDAPIVLTNSEYRFVIAEQAQEAGVKLGAILLEPMVRNTAVAIASAAYFALRQNEDAVLHILASDHAIAADEAYYDAVNAADTAARDGWLVTFGIVPTRPETGYGYIAVGEALANGASKVARFVEKPDLEKAEAFLAEGGYVWNSGMFMIAAKTFVAECEALAPETADAARKAVELAQSDLDFIRLDVTPFEAAPSISVDYAIFERTAKAAVLPVTFDWSDLGSWDAVWTASDKDDACNVILGKASLWETSNSLVISETAHVVVQGMDDIAVITSEDAIFVGRLSQAQKLGRIVKVLSTEVSTQALTEIHRTAYRPWGGYSSVLHGERFQVKRLFVKPGKKLSLQKHFHRAEHWIVVSGTAEVTIDGKVSQLSENQSIYLPLGCVHRLANPGRILLELIEVQTGSYLGEDDIVRIEDEFGRA